jgi:hypothetical protein
MMLNVSAQVVDYIVPTITAIKTPAHGSSPHVSISVTEYLGISTAKVFI